MPSTLIVQSHSATLPYNWIESCLQSVRDWSDMNQYEYRFIDDALFGLLPEEIRIKTRHQKVIASDLARLLLIKNCLTEGYEKVIWLDADFLIFNPVEFKLPDFSYSVGREVWVQNDKQGNLKIYKKVHNAFLMFTKNNSFLDFYIETANRLLIRNEGTIPAQFIGPKLLTAIHNIAMLPVMESANMLSPLVIKDILGGAGAALELFQKHSPQPMTGANLCISSCARDEVSPEEIQQLIKILLKDGIIR